MVSPTHGVLRQRNDPFWFTGGVRSRIGNLYDLLIFSSLLLSFECIAMAYVSCIIQQTAWNLMAAVIPFLVAFSIYNLNRKTDEDEDKINRQDRFMFTKRYEVPLYYGSLISLAAALGLAALYGIPALLATAAPFLLGTFYSFRLLPGQCGYRRLKEIPAVKNIVVGLAWATLLAFLPVFIAGGTPDARTIVTFLLFFMWGFMASLIPDVRDREGDARAGVMTIPVIVGETRTKRVLTMVLLGLGIPIVIYSILFLSPFTTGVLLAANLYSHGCAHLLEKEEMWDILADAVSDGMYICIAIAIIFITSYYPVV
jgi:4-hydroxybenzoate polyprenyltransferase